MSTNLTTPGKKSFKAFYALIFIELSVIGLIKLSIGEIFIFPITFLLGDGFIIFFGALALFSFLYFFFRKKIKLKRKVIVPLFVSIIIILAMTLYSLIVADFNNDTAYFTKQFASYLAVFRSNLNIAEVSNIYLYNFGGVIGEALALPFALLIPGLSLALIITLIALSAFVLAYPFLKALVLWIKKEIAISKKRAAILREAALLDVPEVVLETFKEEEKAKEQIEPVGLEREPEEEETVRQTGLKFISNEYKNTAILPKISEDSGDPLIPTLDFDDEEVRPVEKEIIIEEETEETVFPGLSVTVANDDELIELEVPEVRTVLKETTEESRLKAVDEEISLTPVAEEIAPRVVEVIKEKPSLIDDDELLPPDYTEEEKVPERQNLYENYVAPPINLLDQKEESLKNEENKVHAEQNKEIINQAFLDFGVGAEVVGYTIGAAFTRFDVKTDATVSVNAINPFIKDISQRLHGVSTRFEQVVLGRTTSGLEVPNAHRTVVTFRECLEALPERRKKITIPLGKDVAGEVLSAAFSDFPHLLVAGATGSGKSVFVHSVLMSLIMQHSPDELRLLIIDPKRVELSKYNDIPHLLGPIVKEASEAKVALMRLVEDMGERYKELERESASSIDEYNELMEAYGRPLMPYIIVIVDEYADLYESEKEISSPILQLAQKSRAAGIYLLIATQRPSVQIITGVIKANLPSRVAFMTASNIDSQTIVGVGGAEQLLGNGDMLVESNRGLRRKGLTRLQGMLVRPLEIIRVVKYLKDNYKTSYDPRYVDLEERQTYGDDSFESAENEPEYNDILSYVLTQDRISISRIQGVFQIGFPRAKRFYETFVEKGIIERTDDSRSSRGALVLGVKNSEE